MRLSRVAIPILTTLIAHVAAQDVDFDDLPSQCQSVCAPVVSLTQSCDQQFNDDDNGQRNCVCTAANAVTVIPLCEACYAMFDPDGHDNDVYDLVTECAFTTTSYNPTAAATGVAGVVTTPGAIVPGAVSVGATAPIVPGPVSVGATAPIVPGATTTAAVLGAGTPTIITPVAYTGAAVKGTELEKAVGLAAGLLGFIGALVA